ncbi:MAG: YciI family protein [Erysipelotrichaceae bacterium]|nr:YciI family protein [Erysipelotrichaceae bacterium]
MQFVITAYDGEGMLEKRMEVRPAHLANMSQIKGKVVCAGGLLDEEGKMKGSVMVMDFPSKELFDEYLESEPYIKAGVWQKITVERMNVVLLNGEKYIQ